MSKALFARYRWGLQNLMDTLGPEHPRLTAVRILQQHLIENLNNPPAREEVLQRLNQLSLELTGKAFDRFCELSQAPSVEKPQTAPQKDVVNSEEIPATFEEYTQWIQPLLDTGQLKLPTVRKFVQIRTLTILQNLDGMQKGQVIQFLYDAALLFATSHSLSFAQANLMNAILVEADLGGINLAEADLTGANLVGATLTQATMMRTNLTGTNLSWAIMPGANLSHAELGGAVLTGTDLRMADLQGAHLVKANLKQADLAQSQLMGVNLLGANLKGTILTMVNLTGATLLWADLESTRLDGVQLTNATYNQHTQWPENFDPVNRGAVKID